MKSREFIMERDYNETNSNNTMDNTIETTNMPSWMDCCTRMSPIELIVKISY